jgi:3-dehydrosphinganine reductase
LPHAIISGGSSGIGFALAHLLVDAGYSVTLLARDPARLEQARSELASKGAKVLALSADVADEPAVQAALAEAQKTFGVPDLVIANAGIVVPGHFRTMDASAFRDTMETNFFGVVNLLRAALPHVPRGGRLVLVSSGAGLIGLYGYSSYAPSKFAVRGLAEVLRAEFKPDGIGVSVVYLPDVETPQLASEEALRPAATKAIAGGAKALSADQAARAILHGIKKGKFAITAGAEMTALNRLHSLLAPVLNRFWFDPVVARALKKEKS